MLAARWPLAVWARSLAMLLRGSVLRPAVGAICDALAYIEVGDACP